MFAKGRQEKGYSAKTEVKKIYPQAYCRKVEYTVITGKFFAVFENKDSELPLKVRSTAEEAWEALLLEWELSKK